MPTPEETLWKYDLHTIAKHKILGSYLKAWTPILTMPGFNGRIVYIDGFAGPGEDLNHEHNGSPLIALDSVVNHVFRSRFQAEIVMYFIEKRQDRAKHLQELIPEKFPELPEFLKYAVENSEFLQSLRGILNNLEKQKMRLAPTFCFVDPFGWKDLDLQLFARYMTENKAELFITFMAGFIQRFSTDEAHMPSLEKLFSDEQMINASTLDSDEKGPYLLNAFMLNLNDEIKKTGIDKKIYSIAFETRNSSNNLEYYLIYLTSHEKGMEVMKNAMYSVSYHGEFKFSDFNFEPQQSSLVDYGLTEEWPDKAGYDLYEKIKEKRLIGTEIQVTKAASIVTLETKWTFKKSILKSLEIKGKLEFRGNRPRAGTFPDRGYVVFH